MPTSPVVKASLALVLLGCSSAPSAPPFEERSLRLTLEELAAVPESATPLVLDFSGAGSGLPDAAGAPTGFSMYLPRRDAGGSLPENLRIDTEATALAVTTTAGILQAGIDDQDNALGVRLPLPNGTFRVEATLLAPPEGAGGYEQAGLWFGLSQRDYVKLVIASAPAEPQLQAGIEVDNVPRPGVASALSLPLERLRLSLEIDPTLREVRCFAAPGASDERLLAIFSDVPEAWFGLAAAPGEPEPEGAAPAPAAFAGIFASHRSRPPELGPLEYRFDDFSVRRQVGMPEEPDVGGSLWTSAPAWPGVTFSNPTGLAEAPLTGHLFVIEREGRVYSVPREEPRDKRLVLDISAVTQGNQDLGLLGIAFHPEFGQPSSPNGRYMYLHYAYSAEPAPPPVPLDHPTESRLSRFEVDLDTLVADAGSELVLIAQSDDQLWHQGGGLFFHPGDGFLYLSVGDEGGSECRLGNCQRIDKDLFSGVLRIDVDQRGGDVSHPIVRQPESGRTAGYFIPNDNPFVGVPGALEEFYALGLRSPHRMTHDAVDDIAWIGDVGQNAHEELDVLAPGANFQWNFREGGLDHLQLTEMPLGVWTDPVLELSRAESVAVIGGYVYRGSRFPELYGKYLFGDFLHGTIWALAYEREGAGVRVLGRDRLLTALLGRPGTISSFGVDADGELYILTMGQRAEVQQLVRRDASEALPARLSQVGFFEDLAELRPLAEAQPYGVQAPLWSDGADKQRWMLLPSGGQIGFVPEGAFEFPEGTMFVKHFEMALDERAPLERRRLETRLLVAARGGRHYGITYKWNAEGTDAEPLLESQEEVLEITGADGSTREQVYLYPGPGDCLTCHNADAGYVLGVRAAQLNGPLEGSGGGATQLAEWAERGWLDISAEQLAELELPRLSPLSDEAQPPAERLRSYWDSNCSMCHGAVTSLRATWDARYQTPLEQQGILFGTLSGEAELPEGSFVVAPGDLERSAMWQRARSIDPGLRMPPLGRHRVDEEYVALLERWIQSL